MTDYQNAPTATDTAPAAANRSNGLAIAGMVCGIVGLIVFAFILGPLAIIFGGVGLSRAKSGAPHRNMAWAGIILGVIDIALFAVLVATAKHNGGHFYFRAG
jgi:uncharacterized protein DUF4190